MKALVVIGCGAVVEEFYEPALRQLEGDGWALLFHDVSAERARRYAERFPKAGTVDSIGDAAARATHAIVATPPDTHFAICKQLLGAGVHVLCEKPLVLYGAQARELAADAERAGRRLLVNQTRRWFPSAIAARRAIAEGAIGEPRRISFRFGTRFAWPAKTAFYCEPGIGRNGVLADQGSHVFDLIGWILGCAPEPIFVVHDGYAGPETTARIAFSCGAAQGEAVITWLLPVPTLLQIEGTQGNVVLDDDSARALLATKGRTREISDGRRVRAYSDFASELLAAFVSGGASAPSVATAQSVLASIEFLDRAYQIGEATLPLATQLAA